MTEPRATRLKRLTMRANYRGIKEMDIIMGGFAKAQLDRLDDATLDVFEQMMAENDHDLYAWITGTAPTPEQYATLVQMMETHVKGRFS